MKDNTSQVKILKLPPSDQRLPLFVIGDVHGCARELSEIIQLAKKTISDFQTILVGDLFTKGPDPVGVYNIIMEHNAICVKGNHDWALKALISKSKKNPTAHISYHSQQTLKLIKFHKNLISEFIARQPHVITSIVKPGLEHSDWTDYPLVILHAGFDALRGLKETTERILLTARHVKIEKRNHREIIVPINPQNVEEEEKNFEVIRWHELHHGPELIIFGHDAKQGLFRKTLQNGRPICIGLDTGCTYGKFLTGYFPETDFAIQVKAYRKYFDLKENVILLK